MTGRERDGKNPDISDILIEAGILAYFWIAIYIWQSEPDVKGDGKTILLKAGARANFLLQRPVQIVHFHKLDLAVEEREALELIRFDVQLRTLVMKTQRLMEKVPGLEKADPRLWELYGAEYPKAPEINDFREFITTMEQRLAPLHAMMDMDPIFKKKLDKGPLEKTIIEKLSKWALIDMKNNVNNARLIAHVLFAKNLVVEKAQTADDFSVIWIKADARAFIVFDEEIPRGCARCVNLSAEEAAALETLRADPLLCELVVQSQRIIALIKLSEGQGTEWGMESQILGEFGVKFPRYIEPSQYSSYLKYLEKTIAPYKEDVMKLQQMLQ